jgi:Mg-chelatase subunit ChlD
MAGRGPAPGCNPNAKQPGQRRRRNTSERPVTIIVTDGKVHGPELPDTHEWPEATLKWWETWRTSGWHRCSPRPIGRF